MPLFAKFDVTMPWNDKIAELSDAAFRAYVKAVCAAKQRGTPEFTKRALEDVLGSHSKQFSALLKARCIDQVGQKYVVHDFEEHQGPLDSTAARRQAEWRERDRAKRESARNPQVDNGVDNALRHGVTSREASRVTTTGQSRADTEKREKRYREEVSLGAREPETTDDVPDEPVPIFGVKPDDLRFGVVAILSSRYKFTGISDDQWDMLDFIVDNEYPFDHRKGYGRLARLFRMLPRDAGEPIAAVRAEVAVRIEKRLAKDAEQDRERVNGDARTMAAERDSIEALRKLPGAEEQAAEHRKAIANFADGLALPSTPRPRGQQEGRQPA